MPTIREMALMANAVYDDQPAVTGWTTQNRQAASGLMDGFQAATFTKDGVTVVAFRGTAQTMDAVADLKLGAGMNSTYFAAGENYMAQYQHLSNVYTCGHSLGGAITQVVANRRGYKFITYNAPGVAVLASSNIGELAVGLVTGGNAIRTIGMFASAVRHPMQAARDVGAAFTTVHGLNLCLNADVVSRIGVHYGEVKRIPGTSLDPLTEHKMTTVIEALKSNPIGDRDVASF